MKKLQDRDSFLSLEKTGFKLDYIKVVTMNLIQVKLNNNNTEKDTINHNQGSLLWELI
jgi:hypothetical protein